MMARKQQKGQKKQLRRQRKTAVPRLLRNRDVASCSDNLGVINIVANTPYSLQNIALTNSTRAKTIAQAYQFYRITKVEVKWKPYRDTFAQGGITVPNLYYMIDKANTYPSNSTIDTLKRAGAKPRRLDDKIVSVSFAPAVHIVSDDGASGPATTVETAGITKVSPWITTSSNAGGSGATWSPNSVDHRGLIFIVEQTSFSSVEGVCSAEVVVHFEFKKPLWYSSTGESTVRVVDLDTMEVLEPGASLQGDPSAQGPTGPAGPTGPTGPTGPGLMEL